MPTTKSESYLTVRLLRMRQMSNQTHKGPVQGRMQRRREYLRTKAGAGVSAGLYGVMVLCFSAFAVLCMYCPGPWVLRAFAAVAFLSLTFRCGWLVCSSVNRAKSLPYVPPV